MNAPIILLVEDDLDDAEWVREVLQSLNLAERLLHLTTGEAALELLLGGPGRQAPRCRPTVVLLDLGLPGVDGLGVLRRLKAAPATRRIPVFILTGSKEDKALLESYESGASGYVVKPLTLEKLTAALNGAWLVWTLAPRAAASLAGGVEPRMDCSQPARPPAARAEEGFIRLPVATGGTP